MNETFRKKSCMYLTGQHKNKADLRQTRVYYTFASTHMFNTQLLRVQNMHTKYHIYFRGFLNSCLLNFARNSRKLMYGEYFHYSRSPLDRSPSVQRGRVVLYPGVSLNSVCVICSWGTGGTQECPAEPLWAPLKCSRRGPREDFFFFYFTLLQNLNNYSQTRSLF